MATAHDTAGNLGAAVTLGEPVKLDIKLAGKADAPPIEYFGYSR